MCHNSNRNLEDGPSSEETKHARIRKVMRESSRLLPEKETCSHASKLAHCVESRTHKSVGERRLGSKVFSVKEFGLAMCILLSDMTPNFDRVAKNV